MSGTEERQINQFVDWLTGKESQTDDVGAVARFVRSHVTIRPAVGTPSRWANFEALRTHTRHYGPTTTIAQIDAAIAVFEAA